MQTLAVIPARGGSRGLLRKNMLPIDGEPMFLRSAFAAQAAGCHVVVSTDDPEIESVTLAAGFDLHRRGPELADVTVDRVVQAVANQYEWDGPVVLVQPTVQPIDSPTLAMFIAKATDSEQSPVSLGELFTHQLWDHNAQKWLTERVNRQDIQYPLMHELGIRWWRHRDDIGVDPLLVLPAQSGLVDIDTASDYQSAQPRKQIQIIPISDREHGRGHLHRCLAIAQRLQHHDVTFDHTFLDADAQRIVTMQGWSMDWRRDKHLNLIIDDSLGQVHRRTVPMLSLEDMGAGHGDVTINALYEHGADYAVIRPEFLVGAYSVRQELKRALLLFGGTDPAGLGKRVHDLLATRTPLLELDVIEPGDNVPVAARMREADVLFTSAGRTVFEAAAVRIPTIVIAQNEREATHQHVGEEHGNVYLGEASDVTDMDILKALASVMTVPRRIQLAKTGVPDGKGLDRIMHIIEGMLTGI